METRSSSTRGTIILVGTVHASEDSRQRVQNTISQQSPDVVAVELDATRYVTMQESNGVDEEEQSLVDVLTADTPFPALLKHIFASRQDDLFIEFDRKPGEYDMLPAVETGVETGADVAFVDQSSEHTFDRIADSLAPRTLLNEVQSATRSELVTRSFTYIARAYVSSQMMGHLINETDAPLDDGRTDPRALIDWMESLSVAETQALIEAQSSLLPQVVGPLLDERNEYMAGRLHALASTGNDVVAVVGKAHVPGIQKLLESPESIPSTHIRTPELHSSL